MDGKCDWKKCRNLSTIGYLKRELCQEHWGLLCAAQDDNKEDWALKQIGMKPRGRETGATIEPPDEEPEAPEVPETPEAQAPEELITDPPEDTSVEEAEFSEEDFVPTEAPQTPKPSTTAKKKRRKRRI